MKRVVSVVLVLMLCASSALAAGKLNVAQENFIALDTYGVYGYVYARVENVGDRPIKINAGVFEIFDAEGAALTSTDWISTYAEYLKPDEYTYVRASTSVENVKLSAVHDYMLTITGKSSQDYETLRFPCVTEYLPNVKERYSTYDYMCAAVTNNTEKPVFGLEVVLTLLDAEGNILYMESADLYDDKALMPGSSILIREEVPTAYKDYYKEKGMTPATVDAIAFVNVEKAE